MEKNMTGLEVYNKINDRKINKVLGTYPNRSYLRGYSNYISNLSRATIYNYIIKVNIFINYIGNKTPEEINIDDYLEFMASIKELTSSAQITYYAALKKFSTYLFITDKVKTDYMARVNKPKKKESQKTKEKRARGFLSEDEIEEYLSNVDDGVGSERAQLRQIKDKERDKAIVLILLNTGMRKSALFKLDLESIDMDKKTITVTDKGDKVIVYEMNKTVYKALDIYLKVREEKYHPIDNALFLSNRKTRLSVLGISDIVKKYADGINKNISPHKLRATYGTQLYNKTHDIMFVKSCMNHESSSTTELYIRGDVSQNKKRAANIMDDIINNTDRDYDDYDI